MRACTGSTILHANYRYVMNINTHISWCCQKLYNNHFCDFRILRRVMLWWTSFFHRAPLSLCTCTLTIAFWSNRSLYILLHAMTLNMVGERFMKERSQGELTDDVHTGNQKKQSKGTLDQFLRVWKIHEFQYISFSHVIIWRCILVVGSIALWQLQHGTTSPLLVRW